MGNLYTQKPDSPTMAVWAQRYFRAYLHAHGTTFTDMRREKGYSKLFNAAGAPVTGAQLGVHEGAQEQNNAVKNYLSKNGGTLEIQIHDTPAIVFQRGQAKNVERVLVFNCGVTNDTKRIKAWQHITLDTSKNRETWIYNFQTGDFPSPGVKTTGLKIVPDPTPKSDLLPSGGIL